MFPTPAASYQLIAPSRAGAVIDTLLEGVKPAVWGSDLYAPQILTAATAHQISYIETMLAQVASPQP